MEYEYIISSSGLHFTTPSTGALALIGTILAIEVLGFSTFASTYSSFLHNSEMAEVNWHLYEGQAKIIINSNPFEASNYQKTADSWHKLWENYKDAAERRRCSANLCLWGIIVLLIGLLVAFWGRGWLIFLIVSVALLIPALVIFICEKAHPLIRKLLKWPIGR